MSQATNEDYLKKGGNNCPFCDSTDVEAHEVWVEGTTAYQPVGCNQCEGEWTDTFALSGYEV